MRAVQVGHVNEGDARVETVTHQAVKRLFALAGVGGRVVVAIETGALSEPCDLDARLAQGNYVGAGKSFSGRFCRPRPSGPRSQQTSACNRGPQEVTTMNVHHRNTPLCANTEI